MPEWRSTASVRRNTDLTSRGFKSLLWHNKKKVIKILIKIEDEVEIKRITTERKIVSEGSGESKTEREAEFLTFHMKGETIALAIKNEMFEHPLINLKDTGLKVKARITLKFSNPQTSIEDFVENIEIEEDEEEDE